MYISSKINSIIKAIRKKIFRSSIVKSTNQKQMPVNQNIRRFQESITKELIITKDRVRDLIGNANWGEDGVYKEAILRKVISQFLPTNLNIGTGFILRNDDNINGDNGTTSTQLDIIIYDNKTPVIFKQGDFIITTADSVRAIIEVKTNIINYGAGNDNALNRIAEKINRLRAFPNFVDQSSRKIFIGVFSFEYEANFEADRVNEALILSNGLINHLSLGPNKFIRYWENTNNLVPPLEYTGRCYIKYNLQNLSFSYFISNLLHICADEDPVQRYWFSFPITGTKELHRIEPVVELS